MDWLQRFGGALTVDICFLSYKNTSAYKKGRISEQSAAELVKVKHARAQMLFKNAFIS